MYQIVNIILNIISDIFGCVKNYCGTHNILIEIAAAIVLSVCMYITCEYAFVFLKRKMPVTKTKYYKDLNFIYNFEDCPICFNGFTSPVIRAPCAHAYCMCCLLSYFSTNGLEWKCICPLCRALINEFDTLEGYGQPSLLSPENIATSHKMLKKMVSQQRKEIFFAKPWPIIKGIAYMTPVVFLIYAVSYVIQYELNFSESTQEGRTLSVGHHVV